MTEDCYSDDSHEQVKPGADIFINNYNTVAGIVEDVGEPFHPVTPPGAYARLQPHGCRCWFCPDCAPGLSRQAVARAAPILATFTRRLHATLTIDPYLFSSPLAAYNFLGEKRCLSRTVERLRA